MTPAAKTTFCLFLLLAVSWPALAQTTATDPTQIAEEEAVRRQEDTIRLHVKLTEAKEAQKRNQLVEAAKRYQEAVGLIPYVEVGSPKVDEEKNEAIAGLDTVRMQLAHQAIARGDLADANDQVVTALKVDPNNPALRHLKMEIDRSIVEQQGTVPSPDLVKTIPSVQKEKIDVATLVQNGKLLYEMGKYDEAEVVLKKAVKLDPGNKAAFFYLDLLKESRFQDKARAREATAKTEVLEVEDAWIPSTKRNSLPAPNPMATTNLVYTTQGRQTILAKLDRIHLDQVSYDLPLTEVLKQLRDESKKRDPDGVGINFLINPHADASVAPVSPTDQGAAAAAAATAVTAPAPAVDLTQVTIKISPEMDNLRLADVLDAITKVADQPIRYSIEDYAVVFSPKPPEAVALYTKRFKVDPNTFIQGLEAVSALSLTTLGQGGGRGGSGGGTSANSPGIDIPRVSVAQTVGGTGAANIGSRVPGLAFVTRTNNTQDNNELVQKYFIAAGVNLSEPGKVVFFNDRNGELMVRASQQELEIIAQAVETLNETPPQITIEAKFAEVTQEDSRGLGFQWFLGNTLANQGAIGITGGTAPSYTGSPTGANPSGIFPGSGGPGTQSQSATDGLLTGGLREVYGSELNNSLPTVGTISGILTDPQFRVVINALEQRQGVDLLSAPKVTTLSGRQTHVAVQDLQEIVTSVDLSQIASGGGTTATGAAGNGVVGSEIVYYTTFMPFGPVLDVMPTVSADGFSIQMILIPTYTQFIGYDSPGQFVPQAQSVGGTTLGIPLTAVLPLPHLRIRQVVTTCNVWDGQTVVLGGLIGESLTKIKDKVPVLGDLPLVGKLFQSQSSDSTKQNLLIFVTPTIIDPAGNRVHTDEEMPFARTTIPSQPAPAQ